MKRNFSKFLVSLLIISTLSTTVFGSTLYKLRYEGVNVPVSQSLENKNGSVYIKASDLANAIGGKYYYTLERAPSYISYDGKILSFSNKENEYYIDGKLTKTSNTFSEIPEEKDYLIPLRESAEALGIEVNYDANTNTISLGEEDTDFTIIENNDIISSDYKVMTYEDAIKKSLENNASLKNVTDNIRVLESQEEDIKDTQRDMYSVNSLLGYENLQIYETYASVYIALDSVERGLVNAEDSKIIISDSTEYMLQNALKNVYDTNLNIELLEKVISNAEMSLESNKVKLSLGLISNNEVVDQEIALNKQKSDLATLKYLLKTNHESLNKVIGLKPEDRITVDYTYQVEYLPKNFDIDAYVQKCLSSDLNIKRLKSNVDSAQYILDNHVSNSVSSKTKEAKQVDVNTANRALSDAKKNLETSVRSTYNSLQQLELSNNSLLLDYEKAKKDYNIVVTNYYIGNVSQLDMTMAYMPVFNAKIAIEKNNSNYAILKYGFEHSYLLN